VGESDGAFKLVGEQFTEEPYGIGITKGDTAFCEFINETLADNEEEYLAAWEATAGEVEGTETPELPEPAPCV
jgi:glutamate transport system substrate-binding protein